MTSAKGVLDWLGQFANKGFGPASLGYLTHALNDIFRLQGRFVHDEGFESEAVVANYLRKKIKPRDDDELLRAQSGER